MTERHGSERQLARDLFALAVELRERGIPFVLATVVWSQSPTSAKPGAKGIVTADGALFGWVGGSCAQPAVMREAIAALHDGQARILRIDPAGGEGGPARPGVVMAPMTCHSEGALEIFLEPFLPAPQLLVYGESPVADALVRLADAMGYYVVALRPGAVAAPAGADELVDGLDPGDRPQRRPTAAVVASLGAYDEDALEAALRGGVPLVELVASRKRFAAIRETLARDLPAELLARVKAPAGLDIRAQSPEEIAVSILAELIARKQEWRSAWQLDAVASQAESPPETIDPVCGMVVDPTTARHSVDYRGRRYYFCCPACRRLFEADPEAYLHAS
ncbi:XdhC family protein [Thermomicrobium sp. 4228-Ro]|uniref:XdhC family protein n=1 Tax=Thermomicrobium sp. 4228-Ro TaxID=2993937 RepID=UPI0022495335|nr:XdhC family protein [Thermomicrobium sp. 4228-Ro]MCX2728435.1 XdhC family protein [Thermomicrobium sp. 4228-Ro]